MSEEAKLHFYDGQRIRREDLEFLRDALMDADRHLRGGVARRGIAWGFQVSLSSASEISVSPGFGWDASARPLELPAGATVSWQPPATGSRWLVASYATSVVDDLNGQPVRVRPVVEFSVREHPPEPTADLVPVAELRSTERGVDIIQAGEWYLPALDAAHSGQFYSDAAGRWRYDGAKLERSFAPHFDTEWLSVPAGQDVSVAHELKTELLVVEMVVEPPSGIATNRGIGSDYWYGLHADSVIRLFNGSTSEARLRARLWRLTPPSSDELRPVADAGVDTTVVLGDGFSLDGTDSRAFEGRSVVRYIWTRMN